MGKTATRKVGESPSNVKGKVDFCLSQTMPKSSRNRGAPDSHFFKKERTVVRDGGVRAVSADTPMQSDFTDVAPVQGEFTGKLSARKIPFPPPKNPKFTFIDLFAGIGGFHQAMHSLGGKCVFACEWDKEAQSTYAENYGIVPAGDITKVDERSIPKHDVLCAGFPCQAFSKAGKDLGFMDVYEINDDTLPYLAVFYPSPCDGKPRRPKYLIPHKMKEFLRIYEQTQGETSHF